MKLSEVFDPEARLLEGGGEVDPATYTIEGIIKAGVYAGEKFSRLALFLLPLSLNCCDKPADQVEEDVRLAVNKVYISPDLPCERV